MDLRIFKLPAPKTNLRLQPNSAALLLAKQCWSDFWIVNARFSRRKIEPDAAGRVIQTKAPRGKRVRHRFPIACPPTLPRLPPANHITRNDRTKRTAYFYQLFLRSRSMSFCFRSNPHRYPPRL